MLVLTDTTKTQTNVFPFAAYLEKYKLYESLKSSKEEELVINTAVSPNLVSCLYRQHYLATKTHLNAIKDAV